MEYRNVAEGKVSLEVPVCDLPEHARKYGFYNPEMQTDRDISVAALSVFRGMFVEKYGKEPGICDLLCATGARAIRYKKEVGGDVTANDVNENALELARKNASYNNAEIEISSKDANVLLAERRFDIIDIDPFGSPYQFIDSAARSMNDSGMLCVTTTDTAALFGVYPEVSERRYGIKSKKCLFEKELGTRIIASFIMRELAKYNICFTPVLSYSKRHYVRIMGIVERSASKVELLMKEFDFLFVNEAKWDTKTSDSSRPVGNIYLGKLHDNDFCRKVLDEINKRGIGGVKITSTMLGECDCLFYYETPYLESNMGIHMKINDIIFNLQKSGFKASRTVFSDTAIKTNAGLGEIGAVSKHS